MTPFFSICIPQYDRTSFLMEACRILSTQTCQDFELCISDDCSPDGRGEELQEYLRALKIPFVYRLQEKNQRYDGNLRSAIALASGQYCLLMGNDDCFADDTSLERLRKLIVSKANIGVVITNYAEYDGSRIYRRVASTGVVGSGPNVAISRFRNFSFISGVVLRRDRAHAHVTSKWDGSEMYQMYLGCRIIAEGYDLLEVEDALFQKGIILPGESVDSYAAKPRLNPCPVIERKIPLVRMGSLVYDAVQPDPKQKRAALGVAIFLQILMFTYPFWILEYRRVQSWKYALGICLGMRPRNLLMETTFPGTHALFLRLVYFVVTFAGLLTPIPLFDVYQTRLHGLAKSLFQRT